MMLLHLCLENADKPISKQRGKSTDFLVQEYLLFRRTVKNFIAQLSGIPAHRGADAPELL